MQQTRYIPFTQQPYCCVPACFQMVMYRQGIPLVAQEDLAYAMGLTVPEKDAHLFGNVRTGDMPSSGWGTQIQKEAYHPNAVFPKMGIPLKLEQYFTRDFKDEAGLKYLLQSIQDEDADALLCFDYGKLWDLPKTGGHVCVFDRIEGDTVYIVDPERNVPKYRRVAIGKLFQSMDFHGDENSTGVWRVYRES